jgi:hypothetical protein
LAVTGTLGVALSAFMGDGAPLMNNYVPVLQRPLFFFHPGSFQFRYRIASTELQGPLRVWIPCPPSWRWG